MKFFRTVTTMIMALGALTAVAATPTMECETTGMTGKKVVVTANKVTYVEEYIDTKAPKREIASLETSISNVRTMYTASGITKVLNFEGHKHTIHIENVASPSDVDDYLSIKSPRGHEVIYPLTCKILS